MAQVHNMKIYSVNGFTGNLTECANHFGIKYSTLWGRVARQSIPIERAIEMGVADLANSSLEEKAKYKKTISSKQSKTYTVKGFTGTLTEIGRHFNINYNTLISRLRRGWKPEQLGDLVESYSTKVPKLYSVGNFRGSRDELIARFGPYFPFKMEDDEVAVNAVREICKTEFYSVNGYAGSLCAISKEFGVSLSILKRCLDLGHVPQWYFNMKEEGVDPIEYAEREKSGENPAAV